MVLIFNRTDQINGIVANLFPPREGLIRTLKSLHRIPLQDLNPTFYLTQNQFTL